MRQARGLAALGLLAMLGGCAAVAVGTQGNAGSGSATAPAAGGNYDATGTVPCQLNPGELLGDCPFGVVRRADGTAEVTITRRDGGTRTIYFQNGTAVGADADAGGAFLARKRGDMSVVEVGGEGYLIPDAAVLGG